MNTGTLIGSLIFAGVLLVAVVFLYRKMIQGWRGRAQRQLAMIGTLPALPEMLSAPTIPATKGLYVGSTLAPSWLDRIAVGDLSDRGKATLTRFPEGIMVRREGATPLWIAQDKIVAVRTERGHAGKAMTFDGVLVIRWTLPAGVQVDTGFRADDHKAYELWTREENG
ncbi:PH-like domain-containing protein [Mycolicibacterium brumae]|uniref:Transporter n=1 Tax=Mycolicibacterium brumae TaxID=85968 RepID=A0A2G5PCY5_9MYCO|nr:transporter [Mycolicibacterium brumae]MCV7193613.1 transporter [Mycolicibacterium brumae]PIB76182.1 transporter [Mycolicibacterium brumae]RWA17312.1 hypothetical protein MBRU_06720 [Mycolicibacterium brumae DSM 44177]UWW09114.1 transporter [Mycolicibacterium brumae]